MSRRAALVLVLSVGMVSAASAPALAFAPLGRLASTRLLLASSDRFTAALANRWPAERRSANRLIGSFAGTCSGSLPRTLEDGSTAQQRTWAEFVFGAVSYDLLLSEFRPLRSALVRESHSLVRLHFTRRRIRRTIAIDLRESRAFVRLHPLDLCAQTAIAAQSDFATIPPATASFVRTCRKAIADQNVPLALATLARRVRRWIVTAHEQAELVRLRRLSRDVNNRQGNANLRLWSRLVLVLEGDQASSGGVLRGARPLP